MYDTAKFVLLIYNPLKNMYCYVQYFNKYIYANFFIKSNYIIR